METIGVILLALTGIAAGAGTALQVADWWKTRH